MRTDYANTYTYTDMQGFGDLRRLAREESPEAADAVARQFEAVFIQMMLKSMREAAPIDTGLDGEQARFFRDMFDQQIALEIAQGEGIGLRQSLLRDLAPAGAGLPESGAPSGMSAPLIEPTALHRPEHRFSAAPPRPERRLDATAGSGVTGVAADEFRRRNAVVGPVPGSDATPASAGSAGSENSHWPPTTPEAFVRELWPHAEMAGRRLGVAPEVLLAQSALETGWGRHIIAAPDGGSSHNLFGIKADSRWTGPRATVQTLEFVDGVPERQRAAFRAYASPRESFADYADFLTSNPRYRDALAQAPEAAGYLRGLQAAGYATDPDYADKILNILQRGVLHDWAGFKSEPALPLT